MASSDRGPRRRALRAALPIASAVALVLAGTTVARAANTDPNPNALELANAKLSASAAEQGMVLLENHDQALPMARRGNVAVFGVGAYKTVKGGTGSGAVNNRYTIGVRQGLENAGYAITTKDAYWNAMVNAYDTKYGSSGGGIFGPTVDYSSVEQPLTAATARPSSRTDTAIYVLARNSGEGSDRTSGAGDYELAQVERDDIAMLGKTYRRVVVVLNTGGIVDTSFFKTVNSETTDPDGGQALDAMLLMSQAGQESGNAVTRVLNGQVNPSGRLTDTWASKYSYYPAAATFARNDGDSLTEQYKEGIYVGYRYFDSFYKSIDAADTDGVVDYPFGYGLSYTRFVIKAQHVGVNANYVTVRARVSNVGAQRTGRQVVQVYFSAPQTGLDKPFQQLAGYVKTDNLKPGQSQSVTVRFRTTDMASYNQALAANVMQAGDYVIRVGDSSRSTHVAAKIKLNRTVTSERLANELNDQKPDTELTSNPANFWSYPAEAGELAKAPVVRLNAALIKPVYGASPYRQDVPVDSSSPYYAIDGDTISSTTAYVPRRQQDWEGTGAPYAAKTGETVRPVATNPSATLYDVAQDKISLKRFVAGLSAEQLSNLVEGASLGGSTLSAVGAAGYTTGKYEKLGIPQMTLSDGPAGLRITPEIASTPPTYQYATAWPIGTLLAQTWDRPLVQRVGVAVGKEMQEYGVSLWLAPGMNIHRDPLNGRNFEYYSEDPLVAGLTAAATTLGVQTTPGAGVTVKHFAANNQETDRNTSNDVISERAEREIYLRGFQIAVQSAQPMAVMSSYNKINGSYTAASYDLLTDVLRGEWEYRGLVMSDWGGTRSGPVASMYAGDDLIMPGNNPTEVLSSIKKLPPSIDVNGLPVLSTTKYESGRPNRYRWSFGGFTPAAGGSEVVTSTVDANSDLAHPLSTITTVDAINNQTVTQQPPYASVAEAYASVTSLLAGSALTDAQKAAITVTPTYATPGDASTPVVSYTVSIAGDYAAGGFPLRLGDLQRSAMRVLDTAMHSAQFAQLARLQGIGGIRVGSYTDSAGRLRTVVSGTTGLVTG